MTLIIFLTIVLVAGFVLFAVIESGGRGRGKRRSGSRGGQPAVHLNPAETRARWDVIMATSQGGAAGFKSAITEADKLFDQALRQLGCSGDTMGERLKSAKTRFSDYAVYDAVWRAHKLRNTLVHEVGFDLVPSQAREALADFEGGLRNLGALR